ncbi:putative integrin-linked protein kinase [Operophtera brumata]|uniref:Putative integrin-linked protein kinase n=1 Tax=Operophtera brumata TaxID=104452 RepID=A0A0L7L917_OPEBR|nr:putative integrin-linked protein kinase [Operophtera brumata]
MEDIFQWCREGNALQVRVWLDDTEHDMNQGDDHGFSPLHWACKEGHLKIVEMLIKRGARLLQNRVDVNFTNEHGNSPLHYACFWNYGDIAHELVLAGALVSLANKDGDTPLDKTRGQLVQR